MGLQTHSESSHLIDFSKIQPDFFDIFQYSSIGIAIVSLEGYWVKINQAVSNIVGYSEEELLKLTFLDITYSEDLHKDTYYVNQLLTGQIPYYEMEKRYISKDGQLVWILFSCSLVCDADCKPLYFISQIQNIDERKRFEKELKDSEARWNFAIESSYYGVWDWNLTNNTVYFSKIWKEMLGFNEDEISTHLEEWSKRVHPADLETCYADIQRHMNGEAEYYINEHRVQCKNGSYKWILDRGRIISYDAQGKPLRMIGTHADITARKEMEEQLKHREHLLQTVFNHISAGIVVTNSLSQITFANDLFYKMFNLVDDKQAEYLFKDIFPEKEQQQIYQDSLNELRLNEKETVSFEYCFLSSLNEMFWVSISISHTSSEEIFKNIFVHIITDITQKKQKELIIQQHAYYDLLTNIPNRYYLIQTLKKEVLLSQENQKHTAVFFLDLNNFKMINDTWGHTAGDYALKEVAKRLKLAVRQTDTVGRLGGDEFLIITQHASAAHLQEEILNLVHRFFNVIQQPIYIEQPKFYPKYPSDHENIHVESECYPFILECAIGIAIGPDDSRCPEKLIQYADEAMYHAKMQGQSHYCFYNQIKTFLKKEESLA